MGRRRRFLTAAAIAAAGVLPVAMGRAAEPPPTSQAVEELPPELLALLAGVEDFTYDHDHPAYYALLAYVKNSPLAPGHAREPIVVEDWRELLERPADYRGLPITVEGVIGRNKDPFTHRRHPELGLAWRVELRRADQAATCTVIFTNDVSDLPLGATIRVTGYFLKINRYPTKSKEAGLAALLVAPGPTTVSLLGAGSLDEGPDWRWMVAAVVAGLVVTFYLLWRTQRGTRRDVRKLRATHAAPESLADELAQWAEREPPDLEAGDDNERSA